MPLYRMRKVMERLAATAARIGDATTVLDGTRDLLSAATRANVSIYGVDPRGLGGLAQEAIDAVRAQPEGFHLLMTDYNMPGMSGIDVAREVPAIELVGTSAVRDPTICRQRAVTFGLWN